jgi:hypothetical protein
MHAFGGAVLLWALLLSIAPQPAAAGFLDAADAFENLYMAGNCHATMGTAEISTFKEEWVDPRDPPGLSGPKLWHRKDLTNFVNSFGTWCTDSDPIPYEIPPNTKVSWTIGEGTAGMFAPELYLSFGVGDPITGKQTDCMLELHQDSSTSTFSRDNHVVVTLKKSSACDKIDVMKNNLQIKQQGILCRTKEQGYHGISERWTNVGQSEGDCASSRRLGEKGELVKTVYDARFSVYWDPPIKGSLGSTASAAGFDAAFGPSAAPEAAPTSSSSVKSQQQNAFATACMALMAAAMLAFFSA